MDDVERETCEARQAQGAEAGSHGGLREQLEAPRSRLDAVVRGVIATTVVAMGLVVLRGGPTHTAASTSTTNLDSAALATATPSHLLPGAAKPEATAQKVDPQDATSSPKPAEDARPRAVARPRQSAAAAHAPRPKSAKPALEPLAPGADAPLPEFPVPPPEPAPAVAP